MKLQGIGKLLVEQCEHLRRLLDSCDDNGEDIALVFSNELIRSEIHQLLVALDQHDAYLRRSFLEEELEQIYLEFTTLHRSYRMVPAL
eukprot:IDg1214t1